jgi:histone acetyltransferase
MEDSPLSQLRFEVIRNDRSHENLEKLVKLKNIFRKQLPKMPGEYIVRLVLDRRHNSMVVTRTNKVIGGCCFRYFEGQKFSEIAFLAITYSEQVKGFGTCLMNHLKNHVMQDGIRYFLTYADNFALGYFKKQGFTGDVDMVFPKKYWNGYIKEYDGGTLMVCKLDPSVDYTHIADNIALQLQCVRTLVDNISLHNQVREPNPKLKANQPCAIEDIEGLREVHYNPDEEQSNMEEENDTKAACFNFIIEQMLNHTSSWPFKDPVGRDVAPDYYDIITNPIDIKTIKEKVRQGQYDTLEKFVDDVRRIFKNARTYNKEDTVYYKMADKLEEYIRPFLEQLLS